MEIKEFIEATLNQLYEAIQESSITTQQTIMLRNKNLKEIAGTIDFDLAVEAVDTTKLHQNGGLKIHIVEASLNRETTTASSSTSKIKFTLQANFTGFPKPKEEDQTPIKVS